MWIEGQIMDSFETADIVIYIQGKGIVLKEKSLLALDMVSKKVIAVGNDAEDFIKNPQENIKVVSPLRRGMIADYIVAVELLRLLLIKAWGKKPLIKPPISICVPKEITEVEKKAILDALYQSGAKEICITDIPMEQLLEELPNLPKNWQKVKTFIGITKEKPEYYIAEQISEILRYAKQEGISMEKVIEIFQEEAEKNNGRIPIDKKEICKYTET